MQIVSQPVVPATTAATGLSKTEYDSFGSITIYPVSPRALSMQILPTSFLLILLLASTSGHCHAKNWPSFRGVNAQGHSAEKNLPITWTDTTNIAWKTELPGEGWSSPIVYDGTVYITTTTDEGTSCRVISIDSETGKENWDTEVHRQNPGAKRKQNSYATPTPVTDGNQIYAAFADGTVVAVNRDGKMAWKNTDVEFHSLHGLGASPILVDGLVIMPFDGSSPTKKELGWKIPWDQAVVLAIDAKTGKTAWKGKRDASRVGHVTPITVNNGRQIISAAGDQVAAFDKTTGERIWSVYSQGEGVTPTPVLGDGIIYTSSGFEEPTIRAIRLGGSGDVTDSHIVWEQKKGVPAMPSPLLVGTHLYTITRDNILYCISANDGVPIWNKRLTGTHSASPLYADGRIYILSETGTTLVLAPGNEYKELASNPLDEKCLASMAVSDGHLFIRGINHLFCIGNDQTK
jgi:outer membrane protein assembly factor BamB